MLRLIRDQHDPVRGTLGHFELSPHPIFTLERPWVPVVDSIPIPCGRKGVSCVPPGRYQLVPHNTEAHPNSVALVNPELWVYHHEEDVPPEQLGFARTAVLIHPANYVSELRGCIAPGWDREGFVMQNSRKAYAQLSTNWPAEIEIVGVPGV